MLWFILGCMTGGTVGVAFMCLFLVSGRESRREDIE